MVVLQLLPKQKKIWKNEKKESVEAARLVVKKDNQGLMDKRVMLKGKIRSSRRKREFPTLKIEQQNTKCAWSRHWDSNRRRWNQTKALLCDSGNRRNILLQISNQIFPRGRLSLSVRDRRRGCRSCNCTDGTDNDDSSTVLYILKE